MRALAVCTLLMGISVLDGGCSQPLVYDRNLVCAGLEDAPNLPRGGAALVVTSLDAPVVGSVAAGHEVPFSNQPITLSVVGGSGAVAGEVPPDEISVCGGDCSGASPGDPAFFGPHAPHLATDHNGTLVFTVTAGQMAAGFVLVDTGPATCIVGVGPVTKTTVVNGKAMTTGG